MVRSCDPRIFGRPSIVEHEPTFLMGGIVKRGHRAYPEWAATAAKSDA